MTVTRFATLSIATLFVAACVKASVSRSSDQPASAAVMPTTTGPAVNAATMEEAGAYLAIVGGCHDCHTQGWSASKGKIPPADQLAGSDLGYRGPWGTTYGKNLRQITQRMTEDRWVQVLRTADGGEGEPPMDWHNTALMNERDLRALYRYTKSLGPKVSRIPRNLGPDKEPPMPYVWWRTSAP